jgi:hypothetical protein
MIMGEKGAPAMKHIKTMFLLLCRRTSPCSKLEPSLLQARLRF